jgi:hypothetical protein
LLINIIIINVSNNWVLYGHNQSIEHGNFQE